MDEISKHTHIKIQYKYREYTVSEFCERMERLERLLKLAVDDFDFIYQEHSCASIKDCLSDCPYSSGANCCKGEWKHADEAKGLIESDT